MEEEPYMKELNDWIDKKKKESDERYIRTPKNTEEVLGKYEDSLIDLFNTTSAAITTYLRTEPESRDSSNLRELGLTPLVIDAVTDTFNRTAILDELNTRLLTFPHEQNRRLAKEQKEELYR
jgi:hypothetical protein